MDIESFLEFIFTTYWSSQSLIDEDCRKAEASLNEALASFLTHSKRASLYLTAIEENAQQEIVQKNLKSFLDFDFEKKRKTLFKIKSKHSLVLENINSKGYLNLLESMIQSSWKNKTNVFLAMYSIILTIIFIIKDETMIINYTFNQTSNWSEALLNDFNWLSIYAPVLKTMLLKTTDFLNVYWFILASLGFFFLLLNVTRTTKNKQYAEMASKIKNRLDLMNDFIDKYLICLTNCQSEVNFLLENNNDRNAQINEILPIIKNTYSKYENLYSDHYNQDKHVIFNMQSYNRDSLTENIRRFFKNLQGLVLYQAYHWLQLSGN